MREEGAYAANDTRQSAAIGWLSLTYGLFVMLLATIPNRATGRLAFVGCGGVALIVGIALIKSARTPRTSREK